MTSLEDRKALLLDKYTALLAAQRALRPGLEIHRSADTLDSIQNQQAADLAVTSMNTQATIIALVYDALRRIDTGTYGICLECDEPIAERRLDAVPWAPLCVACQTRVDMN